MTWIEAVTLAVSGIGVPLLVYMLTRQDKNRVVFFGDLNKRLDHLDACLDRLREAYARSLNSADLDRFKADYRVEIDAMLRRAAVEHDDMRARIFRLENRTRYPTLTTSDD